MSSPGDLPPIDQRPVDQRPLDQRAGDQRAGDRRAGDRRTQEAPLWSASWWLRLGQAVLFAGLLGLAIILAAARGVGDHVLAAAAVVLVVFIVGLALQPRWGSAVRITWVAGLFAGVTWLILYSPEFLWVAFPLWLLAGAVLPLLPVLLLTAVTLAAIVTVLSLPGSDTPGAFLGPLIGALVALGVARGVLRFEHEAAEHRRLIGEVLRAQEATDAAQREAGVQAERARLARDIHDTLAQGFSSVVLLARAARREPDVARAAALLDQIETTATDNLSEARRVVYALAPDDAGAGGLAAPLRRLAAEVGDAIGADATVTIDPDLPRLPTATEVALIRVAQGALANVRAHARPTRVAVALARSGGDVRLDIVDDGAGFDPGALGSATLAGGYGLRALRERLVELGGGLAIESEPGGGTALSAYLPLGSHGSGEEAR